MPDLTIPIEIRDLRMADVENLRWSGGRSHLKAIAVQLDRVTAGLAMYLMACPPSGLPVGKLGIDYASRPDAGLIHQVAVHELLQSCGIGTLLMHAAEERIRDHGRTHAELGVERRNPRARALYERLGYIAYGEEPDEWDDDQADGSVVRYRTICTLMRKRLN